MRTLPVLILALVSGCATSQQAGAIAADGLFAISRAARTTAAQLPASARTATVTADLVHLGAALQIAAAIVPTTCAATPTAAFAAADQAAIDAFAALLRDLGPPAPHTAFAAARARTVEDLRRLGLAVIAALLRPHITHAAALSTTDGIAIAAAVVAGLSALVPGGIAIANALKAPPGPDACAVAAKALQDDVATLPAAIASGP